MTGNMINFMLNEFKTAHLGSMAKSGMKVLQCDCLSKIKYYVNLEQ